MRVASVIEVISAIDEAAQREPGGALAFDGDGTLWAGDIGEDFFVALLEQDGLKDASHAALAREAAEAQLDDGGSAHAIAHRIHAAYLAGSFPEERVCEIMTWAAAGWSRVDLDRLCERLIESIGLRARLHAEALHVVTHARRVGIEVFLVSASPRAIVEQAARLVGIDPANTMAAQEAYDEADIVQASVARAIPYGDGKVAHLRERLGRDRVLYAAFGDNAFDVPMLQSARLAVAIRPKARLVERAHEVPEIVVLERA